jgi:hypothetical protein
LEQVCQTLGLVLDKREALYAPKGSTLRSDRAELAALMAEASATASGSSGAKHKIK